MNTFRPHKHFNEDRPLVSFGSCRAPRTPTVAPEIFKDMNRLPYEEK